MAIFSVLTAFWIIKTSQVKERSKEENRVKRTEDSSCSLPLNFSSTYRSLFSTCYIPFQISGSQESNASNRVRFGAEMRKIWPLEDNCSKLVRNSHNTFNLCEIRTAHASLVRNLLCFADSTWDLFLCIFYVNSFLIPVISQSQALLCKDYKRGGNHLTNICYVLHLVKYRALSFSFSLYYFLFLGSQTTSEDRFLGGWEAKLLVSWSEGS